MLALLVGYFFKQRDEPVPPTSPHIRDHQAWQGDVCWEWLCERRGWERGHVTARGRSACARRTPRCPSGCAAGSTTHSGSPVVEPAEQVGGMSPGCATRLRVRRRHAGVRQGGGPELNPDTPTLFRRESLALTLLGSHPLWADLLTSYDDGGWVALLLEDVEGRHPDLADDATMDAAGRRRPTSWPG